MRTNKNKNNDHLYIITNTTIVIVKKYITHFLGKELETPAFVITPLYPPTYTYLLTIYMIYPPPPVPGYHAIPPFHKSVSQPTGFSWA